MFDQQGEGLREKDTLTTSQDRRLVVLSGNSKESLRSIIENFKMYASSQVETHELLENLTYTICCRRSLLPFRLYRTASSTTEPLHSLTGTGLDEELVKSHKITDRPNLCFVFNG